MANSLLILNGKEFVCGGGCRGNGGCGGSSIGGGSRSIKSGKSGNFELNRTTENQNIVTKGSRK